MKPIYIFILTLLISTTVVSQVKYSTDLNGRQRIQIISDSYTLTEYKPNFDLQFYSSDKGFGNKIDYQKSSFYFYSDNNTFIFLSKGTDKIGTYSVLKDDQWKYYDIQNERIEQHLPKGFECITQEAPKIQSGMTDLIKCADLYTEWDYNFFQTAGSLSAATSRIQAILAQSQWLYDRDAINAKYHEVFIWTTPDPYTGTSSSMQLSLFKQYHQPFTDDLAQLCEINPGNLGGVAYLNGFCSSFNVSYADINYSYSSVPAYSWTIHVITHEFGHLLGSHHTHWCGWPGGAIDNCYTPEGTCSPGPSPSNGGTIMSYCHLNSGINFNNGFGPYPKQAIQNAINNAACLAECGPPPPPPPPPTNCVDIFEINNTKAQAKTITKGTQYTSGLDTLYDVDWFKFDTRKNNTNISITLTNLSHPAIIELYQKDSLVKSVVGSNSTSIVYNSKFIGTYYIKTAPVTGKLNGCYNHTLNLSKQPLNQNIAYLEPEQYNLQQNYPNPFNASTRISFALPENDRSAKIVVYNILGKEVINSSVVSENNYVILDMTSDNFTSGVYFYKLVTDNYTSDFKKMVLLK